MRIARDKLISMALKTLAEQVELAHDGPPPPSHGVRLALAVLFTFSKGDRRPFEEFWRQLRDDGSSSGSGAAYYRTTYLQTRLRGVMRAVGIEPCNATEQPLRTAALTVYPPAKVAPDGLPAQTDAERLAANAVAVEALFHGMRGHKKRRDDDIVARASARLITSLKARKDGH